MFLRTITNILLIYDNKKPKKKKKEERMHYSTTTAMKFVYHFVALIKQPNCVTSKTCSLKSFQVQVLLMI